MQFSIRKFRGPSFKIHGPRTDNLTDQRKESRAEIQTARRRTVGSVRPINQKASSCGPCRREVYEHRHATQTSDHSMASTTLYSTTGVQMFSKNGAIHSAAGDFAQFL